MKRIIIILEIFLLAVFVFWRFQLGLTKLFDVDEFAHLHWSYNLFSGKNPYTGFFYFLPPFFLYILAPLFWLAKGSVAVLLYARVVMFAAFVFTAGVLFLIVRRIRNTHVAVLTVLIFSFLPIPLDKWIEIRPDPVGTLFMVAGMYLLVKEKFFFSGLLYSLAVLILPKMVLYGTTAFFIVFLLSMIYKKSRSFYAFILGGLIPIAVTGLLFISYGNFGRAVQLTTEVSTRATNLLGSRFPIPPNFLFYPNDVYYGTPGESWPWRVNLIVWIVGIVSGILSFVSFLNTRDKKESLVKLLISASFLVNLIVFVQFLRLRHGQYLVPLSIFISYYGADLLLGLESTLQTQVTIQNSKFKIQNYNSKFKSNKLLNFNFNFCLLTFAFLIIIFLAGREMYDWKLRWTNEWTLKYYSNLYQVIGKEKVIDLTGETVYGNDGYYFCCVPYGQYAEALNFPYPDLETAIQKNSIKYVYVQTMDRLSVLPPEQADIIRKYFVLYDLSGLNKGLMIAKDKYNER